MQIKEYMVIKEMNFDVVNLNGYEELTIMLETREWTHLNALIKEINQSIGFEFYANASYRNFKDYTSYVRDKFIDYSYIAINCLLRLNVPPRCNILNRRGIRLSNKMSQLMLEKFVTQGLSG